MGIMSMLLSLFGKRKPPVQMGNVKLGSIRKPEDTRKYLAALAKKSVEEPHLEDAVRLLTNQVYRLDGVSEISYTYNFEKQRFALVFTSTGRTDSIPMSKSDIELIEVNIISSIILQTEAERGRVNEVFSHDMLMANLNTFIQIGERYRKQYASKGGKAFVKLTWRYNSKSNATTKSVMVVRLQLKRDGTSSMFHDYIVSLSELSNNSVSVA